MSGDGPLNHDQQDQHDQKDQADHGDHGDDLARMNEYLDSSGSAYRSLSGVSDADTHTGNHQVGREKLEKTKDPNNVEHDRFDTRLYGELYEACEQIRKMENKEGAFETFPELLSDFFYSFYKASPRLAGEDGVEETTGRTNRPFVERLLEDDETRRTRVSTRLDDMSAALAALAAGEKVLEEIEARPDLADFIEQASQEPEADEAGEDHDPGQDQEQEGAENPDDTGDIPSPPSATPGPEDLTSPQAPQAPPRDLRRAIRAAAKAGAEDAEKTQEALDGWGISPADLKSVPLGERIELARSLRNARFKHLFDLVGRMRNLAHAKAKESVKSKTDEIHSVELSGDLSRMLPAELAAGLATPSRARRLDFYRRFVEGQVLSYELTANEPQAKGPIVAAIDCCLTGETKVLGPNGSKRIDELQPGDCVYSYVNGGLKAHEVMQAGFTKQQEVFRVRTSNRSLLASANHPFLRLRRTEELSQPRTPSKYTAQWTRVDQLKRGDLIVTLREAPDTGSTQTLSDETELTPDVAWLLGVITGDGSINRSGVNVCVYGETRDKVARLCHEVWGANGSRNPSYGICINSRKLRDTMRELGLDRHAHEKRIPDVIWRCREPHRRSFLEGYADADGHQHERGCHYVSSSYDLASDVRLLHIALGDSVSNLTTRHRLKQLYIRDKAIKSARPTYGFDAYRNRRRGLSDGYVSVALRSFTSGPFAYQQVLSIDTVGERDTYDIEVEGSHNFVAEGMVVHNSASMGHRGGMNMQWATAVALALVDLAAGGAGTSDKRPAALVFFNEDVKKVVRFSPGERDPRKLLEVATVGPSGGTRYEPAWKQMFTLCGESVHQGADMLFVTDGICRVPEEFAAWIRDEKARLGASAYAVLLQSTGSSSPATAPEERELERYSDEVWTTRDLVSGGDGLAGDIFDRLA